ncbi:MAG: hypothetical protein HY260_14375 [Chloroflexi bacterium]|nr:hypothetical protein [Chloroflexota bacterium]
MLVVKGIYERGLVRLLEPLPADTPEPLEVTVTFAEPTNGHTVAVDPVTLAALEGIIGLLNDLTPEELNKFDEAVQRRSPFFGPRLVTV